MAKKKKSKKDIKQDAIFNNFMEENFPITYKIDKLGYKMEKINNKEE